jgi:putative Ca2+/H+ antiporter (TMEM165/GDT1 family)
LETWKKTLLYFQATILGFLGKVFIQSFTMTMLAEWGDRSQLATVILGNFCQ